MTANDQEETRAQRALNILKKAGLDYVTEFNSKGGGYILSIANGSSILTHDQITAHDFKGKEVQGRGETIDDGLVSLIEAFFVISQDRYIATFAPNSEQYKNVHIHKNSGGEIKSSPCAVVTNDNEMKVMAFFKPDYR